MRSFPEEYAFFPVTLTLKGRNCFFDFESVA